MSKPVKQKFETRLRYLFEAALVYICYGFFRCLPVDVASGFGGFLCRTIMPSMAVSRKAERHIGLAFPEKSVAERKQILIDMWDNLGRVFAEYPHVPRLENRVEMTGREYFKAIKSSHKPAIIISGHFANWEVGPLTTVQEQLDVYNLYRKPNNPHIAKLLEKIRHRAGSTGTIPKSIEGARAMVRVIRNNGVIGALIDQKYNEGIAVPFFGKKAMTSAAVIQLAYKYDVPVYLAQIVRKQGVHFQVIITPFNGIKKTRDIKSDIYQALLDINGIYEGWIRENPGQWLWLHRRWPQDVLMENI